MTFFESTIFSILAQTNKINFLICRHSLKGQINNLIGFVLKCYICGAKNHRLELYLSFRVLDHAVTTIKIIKTTLNLILILESIN